MSPAEELRAIVRENGGGNYAASVFLREDGFLVQLNLPFMDRLARSGRLARFCELLKNQFTEAVKNAEEEARRGHLRNAGTGYLSGVQVGDSGGRFDASQHVEIPN